MNNTWIDNTRAMATISVVFLHVAAPVVLLYSAVPMDYWWIGNFYDGLVRFCVPIFFMISGALLLNKDYEIQTFFKKRFLRIIPPFLFWSLMYILYDILNDPKEFTISSLTLKIFRHLVHGSQFHLWFVYTLLGLYLFVPILRRWLKDVPKKEILYFLAIWLLTIIYGIPKLKFYLPDITLINFSGFIGYFVLGYYLSSLKYNKKGIPLLMFLIGVGITIYGTFILTEKNGNFSGYFYGYLTPNVILSAVGVFLIMKNFKIKKVIVQKTFSVISKYSFGIYLVHVLVLHLFDEIGFQWDTIHPILSVPLITISCVLFSTTIIYLLRKFKYGNIISG